MTPTLFVAAVVPRTGKIIKNGQDLFERGVNLLLSGIIHFIIR